LTSAEPNCYPEAIRPTPFVDVEILEAYEVIEDQDAVPQGPE